MTVFKYELRTFKDVISSLAKRKPVRSAERRGSDSRIPKALPGEYTAVAEKIGSVEIASDFKFLRPGDAIDENYLRDCPRCALGSKWWVFAISGSGDGWLLPVARSGKIAFLDHAKGEDAVPKDLGIDFETWFVLADVMNQIGRTIREDRSVFGKDFRLRPEASKEIRAALRAIAPTLLRTYPYRQ